MLKQASIFMCVVVVIATASLGQTQAAATSGDAPSVASIDDAIPIAADVTLSIVNADGTEQDQQGHYYRSHDGKVREDLGAGSVIVDKRAGTITTLNPATKRAIIISTPGPKGRYVQRNPLLATPQVSIIGQSTAEGHPVVMRRITQTAPDSVSTELWTATDLRLAVLVKATEQSGRTTTRRYQHIQSVEPDPSIFTIPQGYTVIRKASANPSASTSAQ